MLRSYVKLIKKITISATVIYSASQIKYITYYSLNKTMKVLYWANVFKEILAKTFNFGTKFFVTFNKISKFFQYCKAKKKKIRKKY